ncbi:MAG: 50S ribosomal protein L13 [Thermoprotei archaeon]|nr:MAG: 50S ribosomal protein L13 [Thermoprotei archaeon]
MSLQQDPIVVDAENLVMGRLASVVAKWLLSGKRVVIVNAEKSIVVGEPHRIIERFKRKLQLRTHYNPEKTGPKIPHRPDGILKRAIRGMLPRKTPRGRRAFKRLRVYIGVPPEYKNVPKIKPQEAYLKNQRAEFLHLAEIARHLGWRG